MRKLVVSLVVLIAICLFGCSNIGSSETLDNSSTIKSSENSSVSTIESSVSSISQRIPWVRGSLGIVYTNEEEFLSKVKDAEYWKGDAATVKSRQTLLYPKNADNYDVGVIYPNEWLSFMKCNGTFNNVSYSCYFGFFESSDLSKLERTCEVYEGRNGNSTVVIYYYDLGNEELLRISFVMDEPNEELLNEFINNLGVVQIERKAKA